MQIIGKTNIDFIGNKKIYYAVSLLFFLISVATLIQHRGPVLGIDFTGGTLIQASFEELPPIEAIRDSLRESPFDSYTLQTQPANHSVVIRVKQGQKSKEDIAGEIMATLKNAFPNNVHNLPERVEFVGPVIGKKLVANAMFAIFGSLGMIIVYVAFRFKNWVWGLGGVLALAHDVIITLGYLTLLNREITLVVVAALLTLAGYSINDTIVIFDRIRENTRTSRKETLKDIINRSLNETLGRTINTSFTTLLASLALLFLGGEVIHDFALTLVFGVIIGSYSTIGIATQLVYEMQSRK